MARDGETAIAIVEPLVVPDVEMSITVIDQFSTFTFSPFREILHQPANVSIVSTDTGSWGLATATMLEEGPQFEDIALVDLAERLGGITNIPGPLAADDIKAFQQTILGKGDNFINCMLECLQSSTKNRIMERAFSSGSTLPVKHRLSLLPWKLKHSIGFSSQTVAEYSMRNISVSMVSMSQGGSKC